MNNDELEGRWTQIKGKIREKWGSLSDDQLERVRGKWDQLAGLIQEQYGHSREEAERQIRDFRRIHEDYEQADDRKLSR